MNCIQKVLAKSFSFLSGGIVEDNKVVMTENELLASPPFQPDDINIIRTWIAQEDSIPNNIPDDLIKLLHHSCYYNLEATKTCMKAYFSMRSNIPEFFADRDVENPQLRKSLEALNFAIFPIREQNGYQIIFHSLKSYDPSKYVFNDGVKLLLMTIDASNHYGDLPPGIIILFDMKGVRLGHLTRLSLQYLKKFFDYVQEALPVRLKAIHIINVLPILDKIMFLIKPFMKKELYSLLHFHRTPNNYDCIYDYLPRKCLPKDFGGELESIEQLHEQNVERLKSLKHIFESDDKFKFKRKISEGAPCPVSLQTMSFD